ncbi:MAG: GNAT family N-acetyltransferase [bacterium]
MVIGKRINLRVVRKSDQKFVYSLIANEENAKHISVQYLYKKEQILDSIIGMPGNQLNFVIELKDRTPVGLLLNQIEWKRQNAIVTLLFGERNLYVGGVGFESIVYLMKFFRDELNLRRVEFEIFETNKKMLKLFQFLQYEEEKLIEQGRKNGLLMPSAPELQRRHYIFGFGKFIDLFSYSFVIEDWKFELEDVLKIAKGFGLEDYYGS